MIRILGFFIIVGNGWRYVFVADFEALTCQITRNFIRCRNAETCTISAIKYTACYQLGVFLLCQWFEMYFHFSHYIFSVLKDLVFSCRQKSVENRLAHWRVLALALALSDPTMCQPVCVGYSLIIFLNSKVLPFSSLIKYTPGAKLLV